MTSKKLRFTALLLVLAMVITAICGCGKKSGTGTDAKGAGENETQSGKNLWVTELTLVIHLNQVTVPNSALNQPLIFMRLTGISRLQPKKWYRE